MLAPALGLTLSACGGSSATSTPPPYRAATSRPPPTDAAPPASVATTVPITTTTLFAPAAPKPSASQAAAALVYEWGRQDRAAAKSVASPTAVAALFAVGPRELQFRGCSDANLPIVCTYADRSTASGGLYELSATQTAGGGWYVTSLQIEQ